jgi:hypothetical protein
MENEQLILDKLMEISKEQGRQGGQLETINTTLNNGLKKEVSEIKRKLNDHLLINDINTNRKKNKKGMFRRKQDVRLIIIGLIIALPGAISVILTIIKTLRS